MTSAHSDHAGAHVRTLQKSRLELAIQVLRAKFEKGALVGTRLREGGHCACASFASSTTEITRSSCGRVELTVSTCVAVQHWSICLVDRCAGACLQAKAGLGDTTWRHLTDSFFSFFSFLLDFGGSGRRFP